MNRPSVANPLSILVLDGESNFALSVVRCLHAVPGVRVHVLSTSSRVPLRFSGRVARFSKWKGLDHASAEDVCAGITRQHGVDICVAVGERAIGSLSRKPLPVRCSPVPTAGSWEIAADKWNLASFLESNGLPHPATRLCSNTVGSRAQVRALQFPVLLKPRIGGNGIGIRQFNDAASLFDHLSAGRDLWDTTIAQSVISGHDIDCSVLCEAGQVRAYTIQRGFTRSTGFQAPGGVEFVHDPGVIGVVRTLMEALAWNGVAHVDLRYDATTGQVHVIEINPRFWGASSLRCMPV